MEDYRYLANKEDFLDYAFDVFREHIPDKSQFRAQFEAIDSDSRKNRFLHVASFYRFMVKYGSFRYDIPGMPEYDYIDITYKYIALMSLIEAIFAEDRYVDFFEWLMRRAREGLFPITDRKQLSALYSEYKAEYGARNKAVLFFSSLYDSAKMYLTNQLKVGDAERSIEYIARLLYDIRSEFLHNARLILEFGEGIMFSTRRSKRLISMVPFDDLKLIFETGLLKHFGFYPTKNLI